MIDTQFPRLAGRLFNVPLMLHPAKADAIVQGLGPALLGAELAMGDAAPPMEAYTTAFGERRKPGYRLVNGVGVIDMFGVLSHMGTYSGGSSYLLGYQDLSRQLATALDDADVHSVVINADTPGGEVSGAFDFADQVHAARDTKPIHAIAGDLAASAGYLIAGAADTVSITQTGRAGSIGVVMRHADFSEQLKKRGIQVTHIHAGAHKVDANPYEPLTDAVRADLQAEVDRVYDLFVDAVARYRGMDADAVRATEARVFAGEQAVQAGLADRVETPDSLIARLSAERSRVYVSTTATTEAVMPKEENGAAAGAAAKTYTEIEYQQAKSMGRKEAEQEVYQEAVEAERTRIAAILNSEHAEGREALARTLALTTDTAPDEAARLLQAAPKQAAEAAGRASPLHQAMAAQGSPNVGDGGGEAGTAGDQPTAKQIAASYLNSIGATPPASH